MSSECTSRALMRGLGAMHVKQGKNTVSTRVAHALGFWPLDLVAVVSSSSGRCHPMRP